MWILNFSQVWIYSLCKYLMNNWILGLNSFQNSGEQSVGKALVFFFGSLLFWLPPKRKKNFYPKSWRVHDFVGTPKMSIFFFRLSKSYIFDKQWDKKRNIKNISFLIHGTPPRPVLFFVITYLNLLVIW